MFFLFGPGYALGLLSIVYCLLSAVVSVSVRISILLTGNKPASNYCINLHFFTPLIIQLWHLLFLCRDNGAPERHAPLKKNPTLPQFFTKHTVLYCKSMHNTQNQPIQPAVDIDCNYLMNTYANLAITSRSFIKMTSTSEATFLIFWFFDFDLVKSL